MAEQPGRTDPQTIPRTLARLEVGGMEVEVWACQRRRCFGRWDVYIEPARGRGGRWVREVNLEYLEPEPQGGPHE